MLNKNYIIIGVVILVIVAGAIFWSRDNSLTPDASVLEKGVKNLTRDAAADMIETYLKVKPFGGLYGGFLGGSKTKRYNYDAELEHYALRYVADSDVQIIRKLEEAGLIKIVEEKRNPYSENNLEYLTFDFKNQAEQYFVKQEDNAIDNKNIDVLLAEVISVEVTGITEPAQGLGGNQRIANFTAKYKATPFGKIIDEKTASEELKSQMPFMLYDDGWRIIQ